MGATGSWGHRLRLRAAVVVAVAAMVAGACSGAPRPDDGTLAAGDGADPSTLPGAGDRRRGPDQPADGATSSTDPTVAGAESGGSGGSGGGAGSEGGGGDGGTGGGGTGGGDTGFRSTLFTPEEDRIGFTDSVIRMCAHAALTYGAAFNTGADDLNVYWTAVNESGGVYGRRVEVTYENDNYSPDTAVQAATACAEKDIFMLLGGIGFDQIPAVRNWAEQNRMLYFHHTATVNGSEGKRFSYTALPTTEKMGEMFAELVAARFPGARVAIIKRASENWEPGIDGFHRVADRLGVNVVFERPVQVNKRSYVGDIVDARNSEADLVFVWLNALESTELIAQAKGQNWHPQFLVFPFNLTSQTLGNRALNPPLMGLAMFNAFSEGDYSGEFAKYADDMQQFEAQYARYRPNVDLGGVGGDLLFLNWSAQKAMHQLLLQCGADCSRNRFLELLHGYRQRTNSSACEIDFTRHPHRGGYAVSVMEAYRAPSGDVNFRNVATCIEHLV